LKRALLLGFVLAAALVPAVSHPAGASSAGTSVFVRFESDPTGGKPNGWMSVDSSLVSFSDSLGADLDLENFGNQGHGQALAVNGDDQGFLHMDFTVPVCQLRLSFGNDDPGFSNPGDKARLRVFNAGTEVGRKAVVMNRDDIMNQRILFGGQPFDSADFWFAVTTSGLIEIVDDIAFTAC